MKVGIVGAGSAGLFAANELGKANLKDMEITIFDQGFPVDKRLKSSIRSFKESIMIAR